jgi:hypothetical protein
MASVSKALARRMLALQHRLVEGVPRAAQGVQVGKPLEVVGVLLLGVGGPMALAPAAVTPCLYR